MSDTPFSTMLRRTIRRWNGSTLEWNCDDYRSLVPAIRSEEAKFLLLSTKQLTEKATELRESVSTGTVPDTLLAPVFGLVAAAVKLTLDLVPYDEQLIAGIVLDRGKCAQMQTGEGKTIAAVFSAALNALTGRGVHMLTFNDYLARRDAEWMEPVYRMLGLSVGFITEGMAPDARRAAYGKDITYLTAKEAGFDYLRDNCCYHLSDLVQRGHPYAIVDEADSILIDEARIPLVIASATSETDEELARYARLARSMQRDLHFTSDMYGRKLSLSEEGTIFAEEQLGCGNLYSPENGTALCGLYHALHAEYLLQPDVDYIVRNGRIELIDELTGRIADRRRWPDGLQGAVEAKEGCAVQPRGAVRGSITMHHLMAAYEKIGAMTATAEAAEEELHAWYELDTVIIPPHRPCIRRDLPDVLFATVKEKTSALIDEIRRVHATGQPILVGTRSIRESEELAGLLDMNGLTCRILNAKDDAQEAAIIADAGSRGAITISTNMAGRGTDIRLGGVDAHDHAAVALTGGLYVIGTNRFESRRIDDQLRGRAGRQGDPGMSRFFISLEDDLFVKYRIRDLLPANTGVTEHDIPIENRSVTAEVNRLQRIIEGQNGDMKSTLGKYSAIVEKQRMIVAKYRRRILSAVSFGDLSPDDGMPDPQSHAATDAFTDTERMIRLRSADHAWSDYLADMSDLRDGIHLRRFGNQDPLFEFNRMAIGRFSAVLLDAMKSGVPGEQHIPEHDHHDPSATWTYMVSDNPFEDRPEVTLGMNMGYSVFAGLLWPLMAIRLLLKKKRGISRQRQVTIDRR